jgi:hypothetical protein
MDGRALIEHISRFQLPCCGECCVVRFWQTSKLVVVSSGGGIDKVDWQGGAAVVWVVCLNQKCLSGTGEKNPSALRPCQTFVFNYL